ncbi:hypothetical protein JB92DRAFT_1014853 [Gautieria morchelliformis]|nr:hypothetical protein JB92DRAFT_1014853 [Gautieria morchelliformis]
MMPASLNVQIPGSDINSNRPCVSDRGYWIVVTLPPRSQDLVPMCLNRSSAWTQTGFDHVRLARHTSVSMSMILPPQPTSMPLPLSAGRLAATARASQSAHRSVLCDCSRCRAHPDRGLSGRMLTMRQRRDHQNQATNTQHNKLLASTRRKARKKAFDPGSTQSNQPTAGPSGQPSYPSQPHESYHDDDQGMHLIEDSGHISPAEDNN